MENNLSKKEQPTAGAANGAPGGIPQKPLKNLKFPPVPVIIAVFLILWVAFWFNFFGVINIGELFPLSSVKSKQGLLSGKAGVSNPSTSISKPSLACPTVKEFCSSGKTVEGGDFTGLGYNLPKDSVIKAAFNGTLSNEPKVEGRGENQPLLYLRDESGNEAIYSYFGVVEDGLVGKKILEGAKIGQIGDGAFPPYPPLSGLNFLFTVKSGGKTVPLDPNQFK